MMKTAMERVGIVGAGMTGATVASLLRSESADSKLVVLDKGRGVGKNIGIIFLYRFHMLHFLQLCHFLAKVLLFTIRSAPPCADCLLFVLLQHGIYIFYDPLLS